MTILSDENIVVRTLLNVLDPSADQLDACAKMKNVRVSMRSRIAKIRSRAAWRPAHIEVLERLTPCTISVSWSDPCSGRCNEQIWHTGLAPFSTVCALTGRAIRRGDPVFRLRSRGDYVPPRQHQMILAASIEESNDLPVVGIMTLQSHIASASHP